MIFFLEKLKEKQKIWIKNIFNALNCEQQLSYLTKLSLF